VHNVELDPMQLLKMPQMDDHLCTVDFSCRRSGKTAVKEMYALELLATTPSQKEGIVAPRLQQSQTNITYHLDAIRRSDILSGAAVGGGPDRVLRAHCVYRPDGSFLPNVCITQNSVHARNSGEDKVFAHGLDHFPRSFHAWFNHEHITCFQVHGLFSFRGDDAIAIQKVAVLPLLVIHLEQAGGADPGSHDFAAILGKIGIEIDGVRVAPDALPFGGIHNRYRAGFT
jgi:hypothetical protein